MKVIEPVHVTKGGWERLYRKHMDTDTLALGIVDHRVVSHIRWDILQLHPNYQNLRNPFTETSKALLELWKPYVRGMPRKLPKNNNYSYFGLWGQITVLSEDADNFAQDVKRILENIAIRDRNATI